jgi:uncharacterized protein (DUF2252 family)
MGVRAASLPNPEYLPPRTAAECAARGLSARDQVAPEHHAAWEPASNRADPVAILERQAEQRIPDLVPIRHRRMALSAFAFYRGGAGIMAADLAALPHSGLRAQLCGDAHLLNFGLFETPERTLVFGLNDFDETLPGPFDWDVKRLAASVEVAGRDLGFSADSRRQAVLATVRSYREALLEFAEEGHLGVWYARLPAEDLRNRLHELADHESGKAVRKSIRKALRHDHIRAFDRLVTDDDGALGFASTPPLLVPVEELLDAAQRERYVEVIQTLLRQYRESLPLDRRTLVESYRFVHLARKVVGVGSVGTRCWAVLLVGHHPEDPLILQLKEAPPSVLAPYAGDTTFESQGRRVVEGQRLMQAASDPLLGWYDLEGWDGQHRSFYVRQLWDGKASIDLSKLSPIGLQVYGENCGWTLARGHARSSDRIALAAYVGEDDAFDQAIAAFAAAYADTNEADHERFLEAISDGRIAAADG